MRTFGYIASAAIGVVLLFGALFGLTWLGIEWRGFFGPKRAAVERDVFRNTRSYDQGVVQQLSRMRVQHARAQDKSEKDAIAATVRTMFADYDPAKLPNDALRDFLKECSQ